jgi:hypothetical protein
MPKGDVERGLAPGTAIGVKLPPVERKPPLTLEDIPTIWARSLMS